MAKTLKSGRDAEAVAAVHDLNRECFVELPQIDVVDLQAGALQEPGHREDRTDAHLVGLAAGYREAAEVAQGLEPARQPPFRAHPHR